MKVLARIPALDAAVVPGARADGPPAAGPPDVGLGTLATRSRPRSRRRGNAGPFPVASIAVLTILAAVAWSLASWNDAHRAERSRLERLARTPPVAASPETISR
jgi:hypothetical protein